MISHSSKGARFSIDLTMPALLEWWRCGLVAALSVSIALIGIGRLEFVSVSAWSVSRTTFFFWLVWKFLTWMYKGFPKPEFRWPDIPLPLIFFFAVVTLSLLPDFHDLGDYRYFFFGAMHYLMFSDLFHDEKRLRNAYYLLALLPAVFVVRGIFYDPGVFELTPMRRFGYPLPHPNIAGFLLATTIPLCLAVAIGENGRLRILSLVSCASQSIAILLTYSRGSWLGCFFSLGFFGVALKRKEIGVAVLLSGLLVFFAAPVRERLLTLVKPQADVSISERMQAMRAGLELGFDNPFLGVGYGRGRLRAGLRELYGDGAVNITRIAHTHNVYVELFAVTGGLGLAAFLWLLGRSFYRCLDNVRYSAGVNPIWLLGLAAAWIAVAVTSLGDVPFYHHEVRILFFTLLAMTHIYDSSQKTLRDAKAAHDRLPTS